MNTVNVLIVGAGPSGLMMASQLVVFGVDFRIVDMKSQPSKASRAISLHPRSLEIMQHLGLIEDLVRLGNPTKGVCISIEGRKRKKVYFDKIGERVSTSPNTLLIKQSDVEQVLLDFLKKRRKFVEWNTEVKGIQLDEKKGVVSLKNIHGKNEVVETSYVIGADGANSTVRNQIKIPFKGRAYEHSYFAIDCEVKGLLEKDFVHFFQSNSKLVSFFPLRGKEWRIIGTVSQEGVRKKQLTAERIYNQLVKRIAPHVTVTNIEGASLYNTHHRYVHTLKRGRCFLMGDAAHLHSPLGGYGMNIGMQEAHNLAWKLAYVLEEKGNSNLLETYSMERLPYARAVVTITDYVFQLLVSKHIVIVWLRALVLPFILYCAMKFTSFKRWLYIRLSQLNISYENTALTEYAIYGAFKEEALDPGDTLPNIVMSQSKKIGVHEYIDKKKLSLFIFSGESETFFATVAGEVQTYKDMIYFHEFKNSLDTRHLYKICGIRERGIVLIRPDGHIAYMSNGFNGKHFLQYMNQFFIKY